MGENAGILVREERQIIINKDWVVSKLGSSLSRYPQTLEDKFPHILERVVKLWDSPKVEDYLNDLLKPSNSGGRQERAGFPSKAWDEIYHLLSHYKKSRANRRNQDEAEVEMQQSGLLSSLLKIFGKGGQK